MPTLTKLAYQVIKSRRFYGVQRESETAVMKDAVARGDRVLLQAIIDFGPYYQSGAIARACLALREDSTNGSYSVTRDHVRAADVMINAIVSVMREDLSPTNEIREQAYTEMSDYAVVHYAEASRIAKIVSERKVGSLPELLVILEGMRGTGAGVLGEGFI